MGAEASLTIARESLAREAPGPLARDARWEALERRVFDVLVVGGGITGAGVAYDLALRGLSVALVERGDWAQSTSSASSKLIHGGLRYLEHGAYGLVRDSCRERALLLDQAAGLVWPERFTFPLHAGDRVGLAKLGAGLALYTALGVPRALGLPSLLGPARVALAVPKIGRHRLRGGGSYLDAGTHDARLTLAVVHSAMQAGALALSRAEVTGIERGSQGVEIALLDCDSGRDSGRDTGRKLCARARAVVLAAGPLTEALRARAGLSGRWIAPTRGSHIAVPRERLPTDGAVTLFSIVDGRVLFLIPWPTLTIVGTTDLDAEPGTPPRCTRGEVRYLIASANGLCPDAGLVEADVVSTWAGLRPLLASGDRSPSERSREERVERDGPLWTIAGGKLTGWRSMAERLGREIAQVLGAGDASRRSPTRGRRLCGAFEARVARPAWSRLPRAPWSPAQALARRYAAAAPEVLSFSRELPGGMEEIAPELFAGEIDWAVRREDALSPADVLLRRSDSAYLDPQAAERALPAIARRMGDLLEWGHRRREAALAESREELALLGAWKRDPA